MGTRGHGDAATRGHGDAGIRGKQMLGVQVDDEKVAGKGSRA
jgi:hypothetical protein